MNAQPLDLKPSAQAFRARLEARISIWCIASHLLPRHAKRCRGRAMQNVAMWRFLQFVVYASLIIDRLTFHARKDFNSIIAPDKATKQSRDLKCVYVFIHNTFT